MRYIGMKRLKGCGCNNSHVKAVVSDWKERYDRSRDYKLKIQARKKNAEIEEE